MIFFSWTFDLLLISSRYLVFGVYYLPHQRNIIVCNYKLYGKSIVKHQSWTCFWYWCWKNLFFNVKLKLLMINFNFSQFHEHIFKSSRSQIFFKIGAIKNYAIHTKLRIKKRLQHRCFAVRSCHVMFRIVILCHRPVFIFRELVYSSAHVSMFCKKKNFFNYNRWN